MSSLEITSGPAAGRTFELKSEVVIGREEATLVIEDPEMSRRHVRLCPVDEGVLVEDLGSTNGTFVNGERTSGPVTLRESGTVHLGTTDVAVKIPPPVEVTRIREVAEFSPDVTRPRQVADPDATRMRPIADPDATRARPIADPDATAQRPVAGAPPPAAGPPPPGPAAPAAPTAPAAPARSGPPPVVIAIAAIVLVAIVAAVLILVVL